MALVKDNLKDYRLLDEFSSGQEAIFFTGSDLGDTKDVVAEVTPHMSPAMRQRARQDAYSAQLLGPYQSLEHQYAARLALRGMGLSDLDEELALVYGTFEQLEAKVQQLAILKAQAEVLVLQHQIQQAAMQSETETRAVADALSPQAAPDPLRGLELSAG